ncbi:hypothetical protein, partial [Mesorhizobium sp.]|uniref:hypothetical protein n=1 Tax=Mesorhizobium sp. TaxID=1871066 RepID=UPI0025DEE778
YNDAPIEIAGCPRMQAIQPFTVRSPRSRTYRCGDMSPGCRRYLPDATLKLPPVAVATRNWKP